MTFEEQLTLVLVDKLAIGVVLAVGVYIGNRALESYKKKQLVLGEIAKERVQRIAEVWTCLNEWDLEIGQLIRNLAIIAAKEGCSQHWHDRKVTHLSETSEAVYLLAGIREKSISDLTPGGARWEKELGPLISTSREKGQAFNRMVHKNRFWLGEKLYDHCRDFGRLVHAVCRSFSVGDLEELERKLPELEESRDDVLTIQSYIV